MAKRVRGYRFEMPYQSQAPVLTDPDAGIDRLTLLGEHDRRVITLTLLDTTDERLSRAGVLLAHRVVDDQAHWLLRAPDWQPWLPADELIDLTNGDEIPEDLAELLQPFRRRAAIGPVASVVHDRVAYGLLDIDGVELGQLLDDRVTIRRGGLAVARHREVTFEANDQMNSLQRALVVERLNLAGGTRVNRFPDPIDRLTELLHPFRVPAEVPHPDQISAEDYLEWVFTGTLRKVWGADLQLRKGEVTDNAVLIGELSEAAELVRGLDALVDPNWADELGWHLDRVANRGVRSRSNAFDEAHYEVLDALAQAARSPRVRSSFDQQPATARDALAAQTTTRVAELVATIDQLMPTSADADWLAAVEQTQQLLRELSAGAPLLGKVADRTRRITRLLAGLGACIGVPDEPETAELAALTPAQAYAAGRAHERAVAQVARPRAKLLKSWPRTREKLLAAWPQPTWAEHELLPGADREQIDG